MSATKEKSSGWISRLVKSPGSSANQDDSAKAAHARRREQIRRAQRTHRERKENYIKNLESEVVVLREKDASHDELIAALKLKIRNLNYLLDSNGIPVPPELRHAESPQAHASIAMQVRPDGTQNLHATMPSIFSTDPSLPTFAVPWMMSSSTTSNASPSDYNNTSTPKASTATSQMSDREAHNYAGLKQISNNTNNIIPPAQSQLQGHLHGLDAAQIAIDFVLYLESPCLPHHTTQPLPSDPLNGHKLMLSTPIISHYPHALKSSTNSKFSIPENATWDVPALEIEKLLNLSERLSLEGEITPVEAWQRITRHRGFARLDRQGLEALKADLGGEVRCFGFGAVLDESYFEYLLEQHLGNTGKAGNGGF